MGAKRDVMETRTEQHRCVDRNYEQTHGRKVVVENRLPTTVVFHINYFSTKEPEHGHKTDQKKWLLSLQLNQGTISRQLKTRVWQYVLDHITKKI